MSAVVYTTPANGREGVVLSFGCIGSAMMALEKREVELMERIELFGPSVGRDQLLNRCRLALAQLGRTPAEAWADRCRYLDRVAS